MSPAMTKCQGTPQSPLILEGYRSKNLKKILQSHHEQFVRYIQGLGLEVVSYGKTINFQNSSTIILTLKTTCFKVDFNDSFVTISVIK